MLNNSPIYPTLPSTDLRKTKDFYSQKLGLEVIKESANGIMFGAGGNTRIYIYKRGPSKADHTLASFMVTDLEAMIDELVNKGIKFEQYDMPGLKTDEKGIAVSEAEKEKGAWFKDPDGNILALSQDI